MLSSMAALPGPHLMLTLSLFVRLVGTYASHTCQILATELSWCPEHVPDWRVCHTIKGDRNPSISF